MKQQTKIKENEDKILELEKYKENMEEKYNNLMSSYNRIKNQAEKLSEDIQIIENSKKAPVEKRKNKRQFSLMSELEEMDIELVEEAPVSPVPFILNSKIIPLLSLHSSVIASIAGKKNRELNKRKDPLEEYFTLVFII